MVSDARLALHEELINILGSNNVYYQPPESVMLKYPCIIYKCESGYTDHADDFLYRYEPRYQVTLLDPDPDSDIFDRLLQLKYCTFDRHYTSDNLNHFVFRIYM